MNGVVMHLLDLILAARPEREKVVRKRCEEILASAGFKHNPRWYLYVRSHFRGHTEELRMPDDPAFAAIEEALESKEPCV